MFYSDCLHTLLVVLLDPPAPSSSSSSSSCSSSSSPLKSCCCLSHILTASNKENYRPLVEGLNNNVEVHWRQMCCSRTALATSKMAAWQIPVFHFPRSFMGFDCEVQGLSHYLLQTDPPTHTHTSDLHSILSVIPGEGGQIIICNFWHPHLGLG